VAQPPRPNLLHGATHVAPPPAAPPTPSKPPSAQVNIHGIPPKPNMAPPPVIDEEIVNDATFAEMEAGKTALSMYEARAGAEHAYGQKSIARLNKVTQAGNKNDKDDKEE